jgi:hypothetical protein
MDGNYAYSGPLHTQDWEPVTITLQAFLLVEKAEPVQVRFTLCLRHQRSMWIQDGCKVYMDSDMASNGLCFMVTWIIFKNHLLEVGLTQNGETMALQMLITIGLFYFIMCEDPTWIEVHCNSIWLRARSHMTLLYTWGSVTTLHDFGGEVGRPLETFFGLSQFHGHGSWLVCEVALMVGLDYGKEVHRRVKSSNPRQGYLMQWLEW